MFVKKVCGLLAQIPYANRNTGAPPVTDHIKWGSVLLGFLSVMKSNSYVAKRNDFCKHTEEQEVIIKCV